MNEAIPGREVFLLQAMPFFWGRLPLLRNGEERASLNKEERRMVMERRRSDDIRTDVSSQLFWDNRIDESNINVDVVDSRVILTGSVPTYADRWEAEDDAYSIPGVSSVENRLKVSPVVSPVPRDEDIRMRVQNVLDWNPVIDDSRMHVSVNNGVVTLTGEADSYWQKTRAWDIASGVSGVVDVINDLVVAPPETISDSDIRDDILSTLSRNSYIDTSGVNVSVHKGVVTLTGTVDTYNAYRTVEQIANYTNGVIDVINNLVIT